MASPFGDIGPCDAVFNSISLGELHGVTVNYSEQTADHMTAAYGSSAKDKVYVGSECSVECLMTESTIAQLNYCIGNGTVTANELMVGSPVGTGLRSSAAQLVLKPYIDGAVTATESKWITFFVAAPLVEWSFQFNADGDREYKCVFHCFRASATVSGETYAVGDMFAIGYGQTS